MFSENRDSRIETILFNVSKELRNAINTLEDIWQEIGIKEEQREKRNHTVFSLLQGKCNGNNFYFPANAKQRQNFLLSM